jgi:hypothetical protein
VLTTSITPGCRGLLFPGLRVPDQHIGEIGAVQGITARSLQEHRSDLLDHPVVIVDLVQPGILCEPAPELGVVDSSVDQFFQPPEWIRIPLDRSSLCSRATSYSYCRTK